MADIFALKIASAAISGAQAFASIAATNANVAAQYDANETNMRFLERDIARQQGEAAQQYQEARSDRVMQANQEIALAELLAAERGASASTMQSMVRHLATVEGVDLSRIRDSYDSQRKALKSQLKAGRVQQHNSNQVAYNQAKTSNTSAILGAFGSGLQIYSGYRADQAQSEALRNRT